MISGQPILESGLNFTLGQAPQNPYIGSGLLDSTELARTVDFDTSTATGKLQLAMVLAFSEWWRNSIRERRDYWQPVHLN